MVMHNPPHPGEVIREFCIEPLGLSVTQQAQYDLWQAMQGAERIKRQVRAFA